MIEEQVFNKVIENLKESKAQVVINKILAVEGGESLLKYIIYETIEVVTDEIVNDELT